jgi:sugar (pentulose or hexulose) kinase
VALDRMLAHGGIFRTAGVAQRFLAAALNAPVAVGETAAEGGAWGIAVLAAYLREAAGASETGAARLSLAEYLDETVFADAAVHVADPDPGDVAGFAAYLDRYSAGLAVERSAITAL